MKSLDEDSTTVDTVDSVIQGPHGHIPVRWYFPPDGTTQVKSATIVWIHGGGFFKGSLDQPESNDVARTLAAAGGAPPCTIRYRWTMSWPYVPGLGEASS
ncbi:hypothetical protein [Cryobacterium sp. Y82]|uniref:hypothetical protein n=1 Tax=Cryobacterium sp. Y82 TaxID=2045017 RepID=UPI000CE3CA9E|nr:hypothetical protein [Cryobacterium sp. Y82]